ncbi:uncharacterized protein LOC129724840 [Wyeomyia smithii]|uniref:uncharacterized protein LOC129724840 n=1 Tax=Wyeomyia smithii TaxID=174621 RepID=UPI002467AEFF|nr:uncharacterized protein LOC129724840 [Wyeomyia smithii]
MEYLAKKAEERVIRRTSIKSKIEIIHDNAEDTDLDVIAMIEELKFITPTISTKSRIEHLWDATFISRNVYRKNKDFFAYLEEFPVASAFDGQLIDFDFCKMYTLTDFWRNWMEWQCRILTMYGDLYKELHDDFIRALSIVRAKNPARGSKRLRDEKNTMMNPLNGIIDWVGVDDPLPMPNKIPTLIVKGESLQSQG